MGDNMELPHEPSSHALHLERKSKNIDEPTQKPEHSYASILHNNPSNPSLQLVSSLPPSTSKQHSEKSPPSPKPRTHRNRNPRDNNRNKRRLYPSNNPYTPPTTRTARCLRHVLIELRDRKHLLSPTFQPDKLFPAFTPLQKTLTLTSPQSKLCFEGHYL